MNYRIFLVVICFLIPLNSAFGELSFNLADYFGDYSGAMVILDAGTGEMVEYNKEQCSKRVSPCSTFKIPNSVFGLDSGVLSGPDHMIPWDGRKWFIDAWNQDLNLQQAITYSAVPYFQNVARMIGSERMQKYVNELNYGNKDLSGGVDTFWLGSSLLISPVEQVDFLQKLFSYQFNVERKAVNSVSEMLLQQETPRGTAYGKTGSRKAETTGTDLGWFVGFVDTTTTRYYFAVNIMDGDNPMGSKAKEIAMSILTDLGYLGEFKTTPTLDAGFKQRLNGIYLVHEERTRENRFNPLPAHTHLVTYDQSNSTGVPGIPVRYVVLADEPGVPIVLGKTPEKQIHENGNPSLQLQLEKKYIDQLHTFTGDNLNKTVAVVIGGKIITIHKIREAIEGGRIQITRCSDTACEVLYTELMK